MVNLEHFPAVRVWRFKAGTVIALGGAEIRNTGSLYFADYRCATIFCGRDDRVEEM